MKRIIQPLIIPVQPHPIICRVILLMLATVPAPAADSARPESVSPAHAGLKPPLNGLEEVSWQDVNMIIRLAMNQMKITLKSLISAMRHLIHLLSQSTTTLHFSTPFLPPSEPLFSPS